MKVFDCLSELSVDLLVHSASRAFDTPRYAGRSGFTFLEALITLLISSLILTSVFALARRMTVDAGKLEGRLIAVVQRATVETEVRQLLASFVIMPMPALVNTVEGISFSGTPRTIDGTISASRPVSCAPVGGTMALRLIIEDAPEGGSLLICERNQTRVLLKKFPDGGARFRYIDRDSGAITDRWQRSRETIMQSKQTSTNAPSFPLDGMPPAIIFEWQEGRVVRSVLAASLASGVARPTFDEYGPVNDFP